MSDSVRPHRRQPTKAPMSLGFSRQEHWSGLPFPSPMHESEKWKWSRSVVSDSSQPRGLQPTRLLHPWDFLGKSTGVGCHCLLRFFFEFQWIPYIYLPNTDLTVFSLLVKDLLPLGDCKFSERFHSHIVWFTKRSASTPAQTSSEPWCSYVQLTKHGPITPKRW